MIRKISQSVRRLREAAEDESPSPTGTTGSPAASGNTAPPATGAPTAAPSAATVRDSRAALRQDVTTAQLRHRLFAGTPAAATPAADPTRFVPSGQGFVFHRGGVQSDADDALPSPETREVLRDPADVNVDVAEPESAGGMMGALGLMMAETAKTSGLRDDRYDALSDGAQADFDRVSVTIGEDDEALRALDQMLIQGRFEGDGEAILDELAGLSRDEVADGLEQDALVADMVQEIADPSAINQQGYGTCVPTTASIHLAENDPAEYVRLVRGLASEDGRVRLANGDEISRHADTIDEPEDYTGPERSQSSRLLVPALMEYGNGSRDYDAVDDSHQRDYGLFHRYDGRGLGNGGMDRIMEGITGQAYESFTLDGDEDGAVTDELARRTAAGEQVPVALMWREDAGHEVLLTGVEEDFVYYTNPWGQEERMARAEFEDRLIGVNQRAA